MFLANKRAKEEQEKVKTQEGQVRTQKDASNASEQVFLAEAQKITISITQDEGASRTASDIAWVAKLLALNRNAGKRVSQGKDSNRELDS